MPADFLIRHWKKELQVFYKNLFILQKASDPEAIHDLRVSIKKLRSYSRLYSAVFTKNTSQNFPVEVKKLFSVLGRQRNVEISIELLDHYKPKQLSDKLKKYFQFYLKETSQHSRLALKEFNPDSLRSLTLEIEQTTSIQGEEEVKQALLKLMSSAVEEIRVYLKSFNKNYHRARKKLKDIFYWCQVLPEDLFFTKEELKGIKKILDDLGNAQDLQTFRYNLQHYRRTIIAKDSDDYGYIKQIRNKARKKTEEALNNAYERTKELLAKK